MRSRIWTLMVAGALAINAGCARRVATATVTVASAPTVAVAKQEPVTRATTAEAPRVAVAKQEPVTKATTAEAPRVAVAKQDPAAKVESPGNDVLAFDNFDGKLNLKWDIKNPDPTHYSLTKKAGTLTITSQAGGFGHAGTDHKNVFLVDCPAAPAGKDLQVTTRVVEFKPTGNWSQAGVLFWNDEDNYLKLDLEWSSRRTLMAIGETKSEWAFQQGYDAPEDTGDLWLRVIKHNDRYTFQASADGKSFTTCGNKTWADGNVKMVGIYAKNGPGSEAPEVDASFKLFEVRAIPAQSAAATP